MAKQTAETRLAELIEQEAAINATVNTISREHDDRYDAELAELKAKHDGLLADALAPHLDQQQAIKKERLALEIRVKLDSGELSMDQMEALISGKQPSLFQQQRSRAPKGSMLTRIKEALDGQTDGLSRGDLITKLGITGDQTAINGLSNSLAAAKKSGELGHNPDTGRYFLP